jgi:hypothetical protein
MKLSNVCAAATCVLTILTCGNVYAQTLTPRRLGHVSGKVHKAAEDTQESGVSVLSQADVSLDNDTTQVGLQAMDLFFNKDWRLYIRSTLPLPKAKSESATASTVPAGTSTIASLDDSSISALLDPYGGVLNVSTGAFFQLMPMVTDDKEHGVFVDARLGMKLLSLPDQADAAPTVLNTQVTPFYAGALMFKFVSKLSTDADGEHTAGGFELGLGYLVNVTADKAASGVFTTQTLEPTSHAVRVDLAISLTKVAAIDLSWSPWNSMGFGKRFVVGLKLLSQSPAVE